MRPAAQQVLTYLGVVSLLAPACQQPGGVADVLLVARVEVTPPSAAFSLQETLQLEATPKTEGGLSLPSRDVIWSSSAPTLASVSETGLVRALAVGGPVLIRATVEGVSGEASITVTPVAIDRITVTPSQSSVVISATAQLSATAYDAGGNVLAGHSFVWESSAPTLAPVTTTGLVIGLAVGGPVTVTATSGGRSADASITVTERPATRLGFLQQPGPATAGQTMVPAIRVAIQDDLLGTVTGATNSVTLALVGNPGGATLSGIKTMAAVNGIATFSNLSLDRAGTGYTLLATASGLSSITSSPFNVSAGPASRLGFTIAPPVAASSGVAFSPQPLLQLRDGAGNPVALAGTVITATIASGAGSLGGTTAATTNAAGAAAFSNLSLVGSVGSYTVAFSAAGMLPITSSTITLGAGPPAALTITTQPSSSAQSGVALPRQPVIRLRDASGNPVSQAGVAITASISSGPAGGTPGGATVVTTNGSGVASYANLSLSGPSGSYTLGFAASGLAGATSSSISLSAGAGTSLVLTTQPSSTIASGAVFPQQPVVQLRDGANNPVALAGVLVTASIQSGGGTLGGTTTIGTNSSGSASFGNLAISGTVGNRTLVFTASGYVSAVSGTIAVTAGSPSQLSIATQPSSSAQSGVAFAQQPVITLSDASNNPISGIVVTASIASGGGTLGGTATATTNASGQATFTGLSIAGAAGDYTLSFSAPGLTAAVSNRISLAGGAPSQLGITTQPSSTALVDVAFARQPVIQLLDAAGNALSQAGVAILAEINSGPGQVKGTVSVATDAAGVATYTDLALDQAGSYTLKFTSPSLTQVVSSTITVAAPGPSPSQLNIKTQPPSSAQSGVVFAQQPVIEVRDASNTPVGGVVVTAAIASGGGALGGTASATSNASGDASFGGLSISGPVGNQTLRFSAQGVPDAMSNAINLSAGPASQLTISTQPSASVQDDDPFPQQPVIQLRDAAGNPVSQSGVVVTAAINSGSGGAQLKGTKTRTTNASGVATFSNLELDKTGTYTLKFTSPGLTHAISITITVN